MGRKPASALLQGAFRPTVRIIQGQAIIPAPKEFDPVDLLCNAMSAARARKGPDVRPIDFLKRLKFLGTLANDKGLRSLRRHLTADEDFRLVPGQLPHIAQLRHVEVVVK